VKHVVVLSSPSVNWILLRQIAICEKTRLGGFFYGLLPANKHGNLLIATSFFPFPESTHHKGHKIW
ncbi:MAG: hypothetical protein RSE37_23660, partial [Citrobacter sp.]